jgi:hypothetical protein
VLKLSKRKPKTRKITAKDVAAAFNNHFWKTIHAKEELLCCGRGTRITIYNDKVLLRKIMEDLGFSEAEIERNIHA